MRFSSEKEQTKIFRTVYAFGSFCDKIYGYMTLQPDGKILGYYHPNEARYEIRKGKLYFFHENGYITSVLDYYPETNMFMGFVYNKKYPLFLAPVITLNQFNSRLEYPPILINSIPKSGTYFLERALIEIGYNSHRLHLSGYNIVDDYRGISDEEMHVDPEKVRIYLPVYLITSLLKNGELVVGHIESKEVIYEIKKQDILLIYLVRNLRNVLVSLYRFKYNKVKPNDSIPNDYYWRKVTKDKERFKAFLLVYFEYDLSHIKNIASLICEENEREKDNVIIIRFEDLVNLKLGNEIKKKISHIHRDLFKFIEIGLKKALFTKTSTFSGKISNFEELWDDEVEEFFEISGLKKLNQLLGYEK